MDFINDFDFSIEAFCSGHNEYNVTGESVAI
jgi:hypothetical protein